MISLTYTLEGFISSVLAPFCGTLTDNSSNRKKYLSILLWFSIAVSIFQGALLFFESEMVLVLLVVTVVFIGSTYQFLRALHMAYLPEIGSTTVERAQLSVHFYTLSNAFSLCIIFFGGAVAVLANGIDDIHKIQNNTNAENNSIKQIATNTTMATENLNTVQVAQVTTLTVTLLTTFLVATGLHRLEERPKEQHQVKQYNGFI